jgi:hypothetical protein
MRTIIQMASIFVVMNALGMSASGANPASQNAPNLRAKVSVPGKIQSGQTVVLIFTLYNEGQQQLNATRGVCTPVVEVRRQSTRKVISRYPGTQPCIESLIKFQVAPEASVTLTQRFQAASTRGNRWTPGTYSLKAQLPLRRLLGNAQNSMPVTVVAPTIQFQVTR